MSPSPKCFAICLIVTIGLLACGKSPSDVPAKQETTSPGVPAQAVEINKPIAPANIDLVYKIVQGPAYDPVTDTLSYTINVTNNGKAVLVSKGARPVQLGVVILGPDGSHATPPGTRGFVRVALPHALSPGEKIEVPVRFKVAPTIGGSVAIDGVQERVRWFSDYKKPLFNLGRFTRCDNEKASVCDFSGKPVPEQ